MDLLIDRIASPIGTILLVSDGEAVRALDFEDYEDRLALLLRRHYGTYSLTPATDPGGVRAPLRDYFAGNYAALDRVRVRTAGTPFQRSVWAALRTIPARSAISYGQLAIRLGTPKASRAVGLANGANPVAIIVPCHRVIGADGGLTGYGGGLPRKRWLLDHEGATFRA